MILKSRHIVAAIALHLLLFGLLLGGAQCTHKPEPVSVIQGRLIRADELPRLQSEPTPQPKTIEPPSPEPTPPAAPPEPPKPDPAEQQRVQQQRQKEQAAAQAKDEAKRKADELLLKEQADAKLAAQKAADLKKQTEAEEKKLKADEAKKQAEADDKKRADELLKAAAAEDNKRAAEDKKKKEFQARLDAEAKRLREAELAEALGAESEDRQKQELSLWGTQLKAALQRAWSRPPGLDQNLKCAINVQLSATGEVLTARVKTSSGNPVYDDSVVKAAYKASPLPLPRDPTVFQNSINITFTP